MCKTQQTRETNAHALSGIRTLHQTAADLRFRRHGHRGWLFRRVIDPHYEADMELINTLSGQTQFLNAKIGGTYSYHWA
jgi:hypothetical protein